MNKAKHNSGVTIFLPGLVPERYLGLQTKYIANLNNTGKREVIEFDARWFTDESPKDKALRARGLVGDLLAEGREVSLDAFSGGGALAIDLLFSFPSIAKARLVAGKVTNPSIRNERDAYYDRMAPAILESVAISDRLLQRPLPGADRVTTYHPLHDSIVPYADTVIAGAEQKRLYAVGHLASIVAACAFVFNKP